MPNLFGPSAGISPSQAYKLYDPRFARQHRDRFRRDAIADLYKANSLYVPSGRYPARGWILLRRADYDQVSKYSTALRWQIDDFKNTTLTFKGLSIVQARCVTRGIAADPEAIYLVELTDARGVLWNKWFQFPTSSQYNLRAPAYPELYCSGSMNAGIHWTWNTMVGNLWTQMVAFLGSYPGLPLVPAGTPEGFSFPGTSAWTALNDILDLLGCVIAVDLTNSAPYTIVSRGAADTSLAALQDAYAGALEDDLEYIDTGSGRVPGSVTVYFHRRNQYYGTEETVRDDGLQWQTTPSYTVTVAAPAQFTGAVGSHVLWDDFTVRYDVDGNPLAADVATAATIAAERVTQFYSNIYTDTVGYLHQVYSGVLPFVTGSSIDGVCFRQDFRNGRAGWQTEIKRGRQPPWEV